MQIKFPQTPRSIAIEVALTDQEFEDMCVANPHVEITRTENGVMVVFRPTEDSK